MYIPAQFKSKQLTDAIELMKSHPFATLITNDDDGWPFITYLPLHLESRPAEAEADAGRAEGDTADAGHAEGDTADAGRAEGDLADAGHADADAGRVDGGRAEPAKLVLFGHVAKANPHWRYLRDRGNATVSFLGPHAYMSPKVYPDLKRVPTWNYLAVECRVKATLIEGKEGADGMLVQLIDDYDPEYLQQWHSLDEHYVKTMLAGIVGFELEVMEVQCKLKLNQHRPESHAAMRETYGDGNENERELVRWMDKLNLR
jgi:transcriptional regulator